MLLCDVIARVWAERQIDGLSGRSLVMVREVTGGATMVALDLIEAGVGTRVLVVTGETAYHIAAKAPVDAVVTAIVGSDALPKPKAKNA